MTQITKKWLILSIIFLAMVLCCAFFVIFNSLYHHSLSPVLTLPDDDSIASLLPGPPGVCGASGAMTMLVVGTDYRGTDYLYGLGDIVRLIRIDFTAPSVSVLAIPRDLWVHIPGLTAYHIDYGKINQAYFFGTPGMGYYSGQADGAGLLAETIYDNFGVFPDHYIVVSMAAVADMIDAMGGIDITLSEAVDGRDDGSENGDYFPAGTHHLDGATAVRFARIRHGSSDLRRIDNQTLILEALFEKAGSSSNMSQLALYAVQAITQKKVLTDFAPAQVALFACLAGEIQRENVRFATLPQELLTGTTIYSDVQQDYVFAYLPDLPLVREVLQQFWIGKWP